jgi:hypothetical protein
MYLPSFPDAPTMQTLISCDSAMRADKVTKPPEQLTREVGVIS